MDGVSQSASDSSVCTVLLFTGTLGLEQKGACTGRYKAAGYAHLDPAREADPR